MAQAALARPPGSSKQSPGVKQPVGKKRPLVMAPPREIINDVDVHSDRSEDKVEEAEVGVIGVGNSDIGPLKALLRHHKLEHFEAAIRRAGVLSLAQMASVDDSVLMSPTVGLRKVHVRKLQEESRARVLAANQSRAQESDIGSSGTPDVGISIEAQGISIEPSSTTMATDPRHSAGVAQMQILPLSPEVTIDAGNNKECAHVAQRSKVKTSIAAALCVASAQEVEALREAFRAACPESSPGALSREYFIALVVRLMKESGESMLPSDTDLYTAFFMADADKNGSIDEEEFVNLYALVKAGAVHGLGCSAGKEGGWSNKLNDAAHQREVRASIAALLPLPEVPVPAEEAASLLALRGTKTTHNALFTMLVKRGKTVALIAEYRRRISLPQIGNNRRNVQLIEDLPEPANLSRAFRVGGATAAAVYMDPMEGGCSLLDVKTVMEEQAGARSNHNNQKQPLGMSPLPVIWRGPVLSELQLAQASSCGCTAVVLSWRLLGPERAVNLIEVAPAYGLEVISEVLDKDEANALADLCNKLPKEAKVKLVLVGEGLSIDATCELYFNLPPHTAKIAPVPVFRDEHSGDVDKTKLTEASDKLQKAGFNALWASEVICANGAKDIYPVIRAIKVGTRNCECFVSNDLGI